MRLFHHRPVRDHRALVAAVVTLALTAGGTASVAVAMTSQQHAPEPPLAAAAPSLATTPVPTPSATPTAVGPVMTTSVPLSVAIPAINVSSPLLQLGQTSAGALAVPPPGPDYNLAGWYQKSPTPGALGPAVIAGHVDSASDGPSVFFRLGGLHPGDIVKVTRTDRTVAVFTVESVLRYPKTAFPTRLVYGNTNHAALRLITCGGAFDTNTGHYTDDIVVLASLKTAAAA